MADDFLLGLLRDAERGIYRFIFMDDEDMLAEVISATHLEADGTVVLLRAGASSSEPAYQVSLADIRSVTASNGALLFQRVEPDSTARNVFGDGNSEL
jgi:hypothetical protein